MGSNSEDTVWITRCVLWDDRRAFAHLVDKYQVRLRRFLLHLTGGDSDLADDLAQDTFLRAYHRPLLPYQAKEISSWASSPGNRLRVQEQLLPKQTGFLSAQQYLF